MPPQLRVAILLLGVVVAIRYAQGVRAERESAAESAVVVTDDSALTVLADEVERADAESERIA